MNKSTFPDGDSGFTDDPSASWNRLAERGVRDAQVSGELGAGKRQLAVRQVRDGCARTRLRSAATPCAHSIGISPQNLTDELHEPRCAPFCGAQSPTDGGLAKLTERLFRKGMAPGQAGAGVKWSAAE